MHPKITTMQPKSKCMEESKRYDIIVHFQFEIYGDQVHLPIK